ncbi:SNARE associated Golgi protein [Caulifigura coniformis]|uniref:TVP38/TMEM64 family membrane protein n=1 Tax=Caulifigura coniformis TaxID=2527983 RepID=A0A517S915_9PLAN|nr:VTT domain-containing protein [Caulifigura coniformis]QDT52618.1 SNARE associated Golgi protein [Caulifigura coniformis]
MLLFSCIFVIGFILLSVLVGKSALLEQVAGEEAALREWKERHPFALNAGLFFASATVLALPVPGSMLTTLVVGWLSGFATGMVIASFASAMAASITFLVVRKWVWLREASVDASFRRLAALSGPDASWVLFSLRMIPGLPFFMVNAGMAATSISLPRFWLTTQFGTLPMLLMLVSLGSQFPTLKALARQDLSDLFPPSLVIGMATLGILMLVTRRLIRRGMARRLVLSGNSIASAPATVEHELVGNLLPRTSGP